MGRLFFCFHLVAMEIEIVEGEKGHSSSTPFTYLQEYHVTPCWRIVMLIGKKEKRETQMDTNTGIRYASKKKVRMKHSSYKKVTFQNTKHTLHQSSEANGLVLQVK